MIATAKLRRRAGQRISSALWALLVMGAGALMIATLSGYDIDMQLILIIVLGALGVWLLLSAAVSGIGRQKQVARATAPVVEEPAPPVAENPTTLEDEEPADPEDEEPATPVDEEETPAKD